MYEILTPSNNGLLGRLENSLSVVVCHPGSKPPPCGQHSDPVSLPRPDNTIACPPGLKSRLKPAQTQGMPVFQKTACSNKTFPTGQSIEFRVRHTGISGSHISCYLWAVWCWALHFQFLGLRFPSLQMKVVLGTSGLWEDVFIHLMFIEQLLCARHCSNFLRKVRKQSKAPWPWTLTVLGGEGWEGRRDRWSTVT